MKDQYPFNRYVDPEHLLEICFEGIYNVVVQVRESGQPLCFLHTATFNVQVANAAFKQVSETFPNDSVYVYLRQGDDLTPVSQQSSTQSTKETNRTELPFRMTL